MTIFHVIKYADRRQFYEEPLFPSWVVNSFNRWRWNYIKLNEPSQEQKLKKLQELLLEYDPDLHGTEVAE